MKIWIHIDNTQLGPYDISDLPLGRMTPETPVWYEGLAYWEPAGKAPATAHLFASPGASPSGPELKTGASVNVTEVIGDNEQTVIVDSSAAHDEPAKCPPSYLIWSILLTVLCCNPIGIIPIVTGAMVSSKFNNYDFDGARRTSECTAWWLMITIVTSLMLVPISAVSVLL